MPLLPLRNERIIIVDAHQIHTGIHIPSAIETVVAGIEAGGAQE